MIPGRHPFEELEAALLRVAINPPPSLLEQLTADNRGLSRAVKRILSDDDSELVLLIDQFEELFTLVEDSETRNLLLETLTEAASDERSRLRVMVTLRADFFDRPLAYNQFGELLRQNLEAIVPMSAGELEQAVVGPAHRVGLAVEPSVVTQIVAEVSDQPGALPMLQYALTELFERRTGDLIDISGYEAVDGVLGALARRAEELFRRLDADEQDAARQLFLRLVTLGEGVEDTRRRVPRREAAGLGAAVEPVIEHFGRYRLLSFDRDPVTFEPTVEVAHEALLRQWPRFKRWVEESRDDLRLHRRLDSAAAEWETADRKPGYLMSGLRLAQLEDWQARTDMTLSPTESEFLAESQAAAAAARRIEEERQAHELMLERRAKTRTRILLAVLTVAALVSAGLTVFALRESGQAEEAARLSRSRELAAFSVSSLQTDPELAVLLAVEAVETTGSAGEDVPAEAVDALHRALAALRTVFRLDSTFTAISADGSLVASVTGDSVILASPEGQQTGQIDIAGAASIALDSSGSRIAAGTVSGEVVLVDVGTQAELRRFQAHDERIRRINFGGEADQFLVTSSDDGLARAWHVDSAEPFFTQAHSGDSPGIAIDNSGERIVHGTGFGGIEAYESDGLVFERSDADIGTGGTSAADLTSDGRSLAAGTVSGSVIVSSFGGSAPVPITDAHAGAVTDVVFVSSDSAVASTGTDGKVRVWDASTGRQILDLPGAGGEVAHLAAAGDLLIASGEWGSVTWNIGPSGTRESTIFAGGGPTTAATISPDGARVFTADGVGRIWDPDGVLITTLTHEKGTVGEIAASAGRVATSGPLAAYTWSSEGTNQVEMFLDTGTSGLETAIPGLAISPDGNVVASSRGTGNLRVWDARDGNELAELSGHEGDIPAVAFSPDGSLLATGDDQGNLLLWDTATWLPASAPLQPAILGISDIAFSADSAQLLLAGMDGTAAAYELRSDGLTASFEPGFTLRGHVGAVLSIASSPDGLTVATGGADNTVRLWDAETGTEVLRLVAQTDDVSDLAFSSGGTELLAASLDGVTRIYVLDLDTLVELARSRISRDLTDEECQRFLQTACPTRET